jgi:peptidoglycan biosynthesis protein MviN/MurJ (putative lipid II flippase)
VAHFKPQIDWRDPLLRKMLILAVPLLLGIFVSETRDIYLKWLADSPTIRVAGSRAALRFSSLIGSSLIQIFPYALSIGIFPIWPIWHASATAAADRYT